MWKVLTFKNSQLKCRSSEEGRELESFLNNCLCENSVRAELGAAAIKESGQKGRSYSAEKKERNMLCSPNCVSASKSPRPALCVFEAGCYAT